jgi:hypothetical protein
MNEGQRAIINKKMDTLRLKPRSKTNWGKGFVISKRKTDIEIIESERAIRISRGVR